MSSYMYVYIYISIYTKTLEIEVSYIWGHAAQQANLSNFAGNGAELREEVGCALRITPSRLRPSEQIVSTVESKGPH